MTYDELFLHKMELFSEFAGRGSAFTEPAFMKQMKSYSPGRNVVYRDL